MGSSPKAREDEVEGRDEDVGGGAAPTRGRVAARRPSRLDLLRYRHLRGELSSC